MKIVLSYANVLEMQRFDNSASRWPEYRIVYYRKIRPGVLIPEILKKYSGNFALINAEKNFRKNLEKLKKGEL